MGLVTRPSEAQSPEVLRLSDVLEAVKTHHPDFQRLEAEQLEMQAQLRASSGIPAPMLEISSMGTNGPFKSGNSRETPSFKISQSLPFPTQLRDSLQVARAQVEATRKNRSLEERKVLASAKVAYWNFVQAFEEVKLRKQQVASLKDHVERLQRTPVSDALSNSHILTIQNLLASAEIELDQSELSLSQTLSMLGLWTGWKAAQLQRSPEELEITPLAIKAFEASQSSSVQAAAAQVKLGETSVSLSTNAYVPNLTFGYKWNAESVMWPRSQEFSIGIDLPFLLFWQAGGRTDQARAQVIQKRAAQTLAERESQSTHDSLVAELTTLRKQLIRLNTDILPRNEKRMKLAHALSFTDMASLEEHRNVLEDFLKFKLQSLTLRTRYEQKRAQLESLEGESP